MEAPDLRVPRSQTRNTMPTADATGVLTAPHVPPVPPPPSSASASASASGGTKKKSRRGGDPAMQKRRCVSTACIACRKRKSKCNGALPSCAACTSVYGTECVYDPNSDHRRKGVYREKIDSMKARNSTLQILIEAILNAAEDEVSDIVKKIRTCDSLDNVAESILKQGYGNDVTEDDAQMDDDDEDYTTGLPVEGERDLARKMGELRLENGSVRFIGGTSHLIHMETPAVQLEEDAEDWAAAGVDPVTTWSDVTKNAEDVMHLLNMYWNWHYPYFTALSRPLFWRDFLKGKPRGHVHKTAYCSSLLVNAMLALGCHFTDVDSAYATPGDSWTKGDHFFAEAKRLIVENDEYEKPRLTTVQALALMSVREAGCGREAKGWVYSGMSFRMAQDLGLNLDLGGINTDNEHMDEQEVDARRVTFWGCFLFDKCWSNYLGRLPQLPKNSYSVPHYDAFPTEEAEEWCPYTDSGFDQTLKQPSRTRTVGLQLSKLCEISSDLLLFFYHPNHIGRSNGKSVELKKLSELHRRLEQWRKDLPKELEPKEGQLPPVILMHMFFHLQYIHLFRPFLKYSPNSSPLPPHVSPRRICTANAGAISKLMRLYKKLYNLRQICNIAVYMLHSACTIHLLNLPEKTARRDIIHGVKHLEEIAEDWLCGRRTLSILSVLVRKWNVELPEEAAHVLRRTDEKWGGFSTSDVPSPKSHTTVSPTPTHGAPSPRTKQESYSPTTSGHPNFLANSTSSMQALSGSNTPSDIMNSMASSPTGFPPPVQGQRPIVNSATVMGNSIPMNIDGVSSSTDWRQIPAMHPVPAYNQSYMPRMPQQQQQQQQQSAIPRQSGRGGGAGHARSASAQNPPNSVYAVDGQDWYLKDSVNWQSGFQGWNLGNPPTSAAGGGGGGVDGSGGMSDPSVFMFTSNANSNDNGQSPPQTAAVFENFNFDSVGDFPVDLGDFDLTGLD